MMGKHASPMKCYINNCRHGLFRGMFHIILFWAHYGYVVVKVDSALKKRQKMFSRGIFHRHNMKIHSVNCMEAWLNDIRQCPGVSLSFSIILITSFRIMSILQWIQNSSLFHTIEIQVSIIIFQHLALQL